jgi:peptide/nickel transport system permease protein
MQEVIRRRVARARRLTGWRVVRRIVNVVGVLLAAATVAFLLEHAAPGSPARTILGGSSFRPSPAEIASVNHQYGFDKPLIVQYLDYMGNLLQGNLGSSYVLKQKVTTVIFGQIGPTLVLTITALVLSWIIAVGVTLLTVKRGRIVSALGSGFEMLSAGLPQYWLGLILLIVFAFNLGWFPADGGTSFSALVLPALTLAIPLAGFLGQVTRDEFAAVLEQPFVVSARARGMGDWGVRFKHVLRHAILPGITLSGWALGSLFSTSVIVEAVFDRPGLGQVLVNAVNQKDLPVVIGVTLVVALLYVVANLLVDLAYGFVDPRIRTAS